MGFDTSEGRAIFTASELGPWANELRDAIEQFPQDNIDRSIVEGLSPTGGNMIMLDGSDKTLILTIYGKGEEETDLKSWNVLQIQYSRENQAYNIFSGTAVKGADCDKWKKAIPIHCNYAFSALSTMLRLATDLSTGVDKEKTRTKYNPIFGAIIFKDQDGKPILPETRNSVFDNAPDDEQGKVVITETVPGGFITCTGSFPQNDSPNFSKTRGSHFDLKIGLKPAREGFHNAQDTLLVTHNTINDDEITVIGIADGVTGSSEGHYQYSGDFAKLILIGFNRRINEQLQVGKNITDSQWLEEEFYDLKSRVPNMGNSTLQFYVTRRRPDGSKIVTCFMIGHPTDLGINRIYVNNDTDDIWDIPSHKEKYSFCRNDDIYPIVTEYTFTPDQVVTIATTTDGLRSKEVKLTPQNIAEVLRDQSNSDDLIATVLTIT